MTPADGGACESEERELSGSSVSSDSELGGSESPDSSDLDPEDGGSEDGGSELGGRELGGSELCDSEDGGFVDGDSLDGDSLDGDFEPGDFEDDPDDGGTQPVGLPVAAPVGGETHVGMPGVLTVMDGVSFAAWPGGPVVVHVAARPAGDPVVAGVGS